MAGSQVGVAALLQRPIEVAREGAMGFEEEPREVGSFHRAIVPAAPETVNQPDDLPGPERLHTGPTTLEKAHDPQADMLPAVPELSPDDQRTKDRLPEIQRARKGLRRHTGRDLVPHRGPVDGEQATTTGKSGTLRAAIFGVNDGLVSNVALIMGFAGASQGREVILLAGISGLLAGAFSMGAGEYISMRVQRELFERMLHLEAHELGSDPEGERHELAELYERKGLDPALALEVATQLSADPEIALDTHAREELGIDPDGGLGSPWGAAISSFLMFSAGALVPILPFVALSGTAGTLASAALTGLALVGVGALTSRLTGRPPVRSALRMFAIGMGAAVVTFAIGTLVGVSVVG